ncbi:MAG: hypothetical protein ACON5J_08775 [Rubripirellula sp.]
MFRFAEKVVVNREKAKHLMQFIIGVATLRFTGEICIRQGSEVVA